jgi:hypothetical protein
MYLKKMTMQPSPIVLGSNVSVSLSFLYQTSSSPSTITQGLLVVQILEPDNATQSMVSIGNTTMSLCAVSKCPLVNNTTVALNFVLPSTMFPNNTAAGLYMSRSTIYSNSTALGPSALEVGCLEMIVQINDKTR